MALRSDANRVNGYLTPLVDRARPAQPHPTVGPLNQQAPVCSKRSRSVTWGLWPLKTFVAPSGPFTS